MMKTPFSITISDENRNIHRQYMFIENSDDVVNKIFNHTLRFFKCSSLSKEVFFPKILKKTTSLCHKVNMVLYHLRRYEEIEQRINDDIKKDIEKGNVKNGAFVFEEAALTAEFESILMQVKATLDILVSFLNPIYENVKGNKLKTQGTFANKGQDVIHGIKKFIRSNPSQGKFLNELLEMLERECVSSDLHDDGSANWLFHMIKNRDEVAHYGKTDWFAFQILNSDGQTEVSPPRFTSSQPLRIAFRISYENLLVFIQDFIAALVQPYLFSDFIACTFQDEEIVPNAPKWYIMVKAFQQFGLKSICSNPSILMQFYQSRPCPIDLEDCINLHRYYGSFYKQ